jgi:hypothetical protein
VKGIAGGESSKPSGRNAESDEAHTAVRGVADNGVGHLGVPGTPDQSTHTDGETISMSTDTQQIEQQQQRIRELNEQIISSASRSGSQFLDAYEQRLKAIAGNGPLR